MLISHIMLFGEDGVNVLQKSESSWHLLNEKIGTSTLLNDHPNESDSEFYLHIGTLSDTIMQFTH